MAQKLDVDELSDRATSDE